MQAKKEYITISHNNGQSWGMIITFAFNLCLCLCFLFFMISSEQFSSWSLNEKIKYSSILFIATLGFCFLTIASYFTLKNHITFNKQGISYVLHSINFTKTKNKKGFVRWEDIRECTILVRNGYSRNQRFLILKLYSEDKSRKLLLNTLKGSGQDIERCIAYYSPRIKCCILWET